MFLLNRLINLKQAVNLMDVNSQPLIIPSEFCAVVKGQIGPETLGEELTKRTVNRLVREELNQQRDKLRAEKRRQWNPGKTRDPFRDYIDKEVSKVPYIEKLRLTETIALELGDPWKESPLGKKSVI
jgi:hypothetical protein